MYQIWFSFEWVFIILRTNIKILINRKVLTNRELFKTEIFWYIYTYLWRKTIKTEKQHMCFLQNEQINLQIWSIAKLRSKESFPGMFLKFLGIPWVRSYIIKRFRYISWEGDQNYLNITVTVLYRYSRYTCTVIKISTFRDLLIFSTCIIQWKKSVR